MASFNWTGEVSLDFSGSAAMAFAFVVTTGTTIEVRHAREPCPVLGSGVKGSVVTFLAMLATSTMKGFLSVTHASIVATFAPDTILILAVLRTLAAGLTGSVFAASVLKRHGGGHVEGISGGRVASIPAFEPTF